MEIGASLVYLIVVIAAAKVGGEVAERLSQPAVLGELLVGLALSATLFRKAADDPAIVFVATIGIILLLFEVGLESELDEFLKVGTSATLVAVIGVVLPLVGGYWLALALVGNSHEALFMGATLTATSVGITARILSDLRKTETDEARIILGAAVIDDILGLLVLSVVLGLASAGALNIASIARSVTIAVAFLVAAVLIGIRFAPKIIPFAQRLRTRGILVSVAFLTCLGLAYAAEALGLAEIIGAFAAGLVLASTDDKVRIQQQIKPVTDVFVPVFFVLVGLQVELSTLNPANPQNWGYLIVGGSLFALAVVAKLASSFGVLQSGVKRLAVGVGMVPRGEVGLIFASVGLAGHIISKPLYAQLILIVFATTLITPPWLKRVLIRRRRRTTQRRPGTVSEGETGPQES